jgi:glucokinase
VAGRVTTTNLPWDAVDEAGLGRVLGGAPVTLLNDLQATAYGMLALPAAGCVALNPQAGPAAPGNIAVIAAGTGLGEAFLVWDGERHRPVAGEGGHGAFAPADPEQDALLAFLRAELGGRVSWERVLSGPGIWNLYRFARARGAEPEPERLAARFAAEDPSAVVTEEGLAGRDAACAHALDLFVSLYGAEAGDLALRSLAVGGVFVAGGIAPRILPPLQGGGFLRAFVDKGRFEPLLRRIPVSVALDPAAPLLGAARWVAGS